MNIFLDTSVLLAACGSLTGASRTIITLAPLNHWHLLHSPYIEEEVHRHLPTTRGGSSAWEGIRPQLR